MSLTHPRSPLSPRRRCSTVAAALALGLATAAFAGANFGGETVRLNAADEAAARNATLRRADFEPRYGSAWLRVAAKPIQPRATNCASSSGMFRLVVTGVARTRWLGGNIEIDSQTNVFARGWMLREEWQRRMQGTPTCLQGELAKAISESGNTLISLQAVPIPRLATRSTALRLVYVFPGIPERLVTDTIAVGAGRTAIVLSASGFLSDEPQLAASALRYTRLLLGRLEA